MPYRKSVKHELEKEIERQGYTFSSFSKISGINRGVLSSTIGRNSNKSISVNQLSQMSQALHKPEDWLYDLFVAELLDESGTISWRRIKPLLGNCILLQRQDLIHIILDSLTEKSSYIEQLFEFAEELTENHQAASSSIFYEHIIKYERNLHTERLAICHYRLFRLSMGFDLEKNFKTAFQFAPFRHFLPSGLLLDALVYLVNVTYTYQDWHLMLKYGKELQTISNIVYENMYSKKHSNILYDQPRTERPLVVYYGKGYLVQFAALEHLGFYTEAEQLIKGFEDLSWFKGLDELGHAEVKKFKIFADCNRYNIQLLEGNYAALPNYVQFLETIPEEQHSSLSIILKASNMHGWDIDEILERYNHIIYPNNVIDYLETTTNYYINIGASRYINIYYELALYYFERNRSTQQLDRILSALKNNVEKYNRNRILDGLELFKKLRPFIGSFDQNV